MQYSDCLSVLLGANFDRGNIFRYRIKAREGCIVSRKYDQILRDTIALSFLGYNLVSHCRKIFNREDLRDNVDPLRDISPPTTQGLSCRREWT